MLRIYANDVVPCGTNEKSTGKTCRFLAGAEGIEPSAYGFGDRRSTS